MATDKEENNNNVPGRGGPEDEGKEEKENKRPPGRKRVPFYLNWRLWLALSLSLIAVTVGLVITFGPVVIIAPVVVIAGIVGMTAGPVIDAWEKINEKLKDVREQAEQAEVKALIAGRRNTEIERKADRAALTAVTLSDRVDVNAERSEMLEKQYEALSNMAYQLTQSLQKERIESQMITAQLKEQIDGLNRRDRAREIEMTALKEKYEFEISELKKQINRMGADSTEDKKEITALRARVTELETRVAVLDAENAHLKDENRELRGNQRRMITDQLPGLPQEAEARLAHLEEAAEEAKGQERKG